MVSSAAGILTATALVVGLAPDLGGSGTDEAARAQLPRSATIDLTSTGPGLPSGTPSPTPSATPDPATTGTVRDGSHDERVPVPDDGRRPQHQLPEPELDEEAGRGRGRHDEHRHTDALADDDLRRPCGPLGVDPRAAVSAGPPRPRRRR